MRKSGEGLRKKVQCPRVVTNKNSKSPKHEKQKCISLAILR